VWIYSFFNVEPRETQKEKKEREKRQQKKTNREL
jgi:hypothetical protein